jgi:hypothetical protein
LDRSIVGLAIPYQVASPQSLTPFRLTVRSVAPIMKKRHSSSDKVSVGKTKTLSRKECPMNLLKYIGMDVHKATTVIAVLSA